MLAVRLLVPWNLTLPQETAPIHVAISEEQADEWVQAKFNPVQAPPKAEGTAAAAQKQTQPQAEPLQPLQIGFALWLAGVLFFALRTAVSVFRMKALLRRWEKEPSAEAKAVFRRNGRQNAAAAHGLPCAGKSYGGRFIPHNCLSAP